MKFKALLAQTAIFLFGVSSVSVSAEDITLLGVTPGNADNTSAIQKVMESDVNMIHFPAGEYKIGTIKVPADKKLTFDPEARFVPLPLKITDKNLFVVTGDNVTFEGIYHDFAWNGAGIDDTPVHNLIYAERVSNLLVSKANVRNSDPRKIVPLKDRKRRGRLCNLDGTDPAENYSHFGYYNAQCIVFAKECSNVTLENSVGSRLHGMITAHTCSNVTSRGNHMISGNYMTHMEEGGECLRHIDNWSRDVKYQVSWFGGSPDPSRKPDVPNGSSTVAIRQLKPGMDGYNRHTSGIYDVLVENNYAEYGNTLAWGNKGRQVVINGNIARFISDYAYGTEGGENIIFSNNIAINCTAGGIVSMYWGEKLQITGNLIMSRHEYWDPELSWWDNPSKYLGPFIRLHHGPYNEGDHYGAGTVFIDNNLFVNELDQRATDISIQDGRDVTITGNKFVNGRVNKFGPGKITVMNNEFVSRLDFEQSCVTVSRKTGMAIVKGNVFRREQKLNTVDGMRSKASELNSVPYFLFTEGENIEGDKFETTDNAAVVLSPGSDFFGLVQDNFIYGWKDAVKGMLPAGKKASVSVMDNTTDGKISVKGKDKTKINVIDNSVLPSGMMPSLNEN